MRNPVAKNMNKFNTPKIQVDRKKAQAQKWARQVKRGPLDQLI